MSKVTSKRQVTIPKSIADRYGIEPGSEVFFEPAGEIVRMRVQKAVSGDQRSVAWRLALFDAASERQAERDERVRESLGLGTGERRWTREELYDRGLPR